MSITEEEKPILIDELVSLQEQYQRYKAIVVLKQFGKATDKHWVDEAELAELSSNLQQQYGRLRDIILEYGGPAEVLLDGGRSKWEAFSSTFKYTIFGPGALEAVLDTAISTINMAIGSLQSERPFMQAGIRAYPPKPIAFIAHGGDSPSLRKLKAFLIACDVSPLVVEEQASEGRSVADNVDWYARMADCAIILATKGDIDSRTGYIIPRANVLMEIGKLQQLLGGRVVYLLQNQTKFPTNVSEHVWEKFSSQSMDKAFIKVARELTAFGILVAVKPQS